MSHDDARPRKRRRPPLRRKTVRWSAKEVDALLSGVRLHGVGKWAAILRHSPVFNGVRTSVDLKDKWRNLTSPVRAAALNTRDHPSKSTHPLVTHPQPSADALTDINNNSSAPSPNLHHSDGDSHPTSDHDQPASQLPSVEKPSSHSVFESHFDQEASMSPVHSQEDLQRSLDDHHQENHPRPKPRSSSQIDVFSSRDHGSTPVKQRDSAQHHLDTSPKLEPKPIRCLPRNSRAQPVKPPSESSVSPEVLSHPPQPAFQQSPPIILPHPEAQHPLRMNPYMALPQHTPSSHPSVAQASNPPQDAVMQRLMNQSLFQSAAVLADYWRRVGHDPAAYGMALSASGTMPTHLFPYCAATIGSFYNTDEEDDDDDDDNPIDPALSTYAHPYSHGFEKAPFGAGGRAPFSQHSLPPQTYPAIAPLDSAGTANDRKVRKRPKTERESNVCDELARIEMKQLTSGCTPPGEKKDISAVESCAPLPKSRRTEKVEDHEGQDATRQRRLGAINAVEKGSIEGSNTKGGDMVSAMPDGVNRATGEACAKPIAETGMKPGAEQTGFNSVAGDVVYFSDEALATRSQNSAEQDEEENGEDSADLSPMGMAPLSFPGLGVEEQRQFSVPDLV